MSYYPIESHIAKRLQKRGQNETSYKDSIGLMCETLLKDLGYKDQLGRYTELNEEEMQELGNIEELAKRVKSLESFPANKIPRREMSDFIRNKNKLYKELQQRDRDLFYRVVDRHKATI